MARHKGRSRILLAESGFVPGLRFEKKEIQGLEDIVAKRSVANAMTSLKMSVTVSTEFSMNMVLRHGSKRSKWTLTLHVFTSRKLKFRFFRMNITVKSKLYLYK